jgi:hypothetical protein
MFPPDKISTLYPPIVVRGQDAKCAHCRPYACLVAPVVMIHDEHSAARGGGFDLCPVAPSSDDLVQLAMRAFKIDPNASDARQRLSCELRRKKRKGRIGRRNDDLRLLIANVAASLLWNLRANCLRAPRLKSPSGLRRFF